MAYLFLVLIGFFGGVIVSRNAQPMSAPASSAVFFMLFVSCGIMWYLGYRGKSSAVANATATATATATAKANAQARSVASSAINLYLGQQAGVSTEIFDSIVDHSVQEVSNNQIVIDHETETEKVTS